MAFAAKIASNYADRRISMCPTIVKIRVKHAEDLPMPVLGVDEHPPIGYGTQDLIASLRELLSSVFERLYGRPYDVALA
jgi:hypothetical protein